MTWADDLTTERRAKIESALDRSGAEHLRYANGDRNFAAFLLVADATAFKTIGVSIFDLPDFCWRDAHDDGMTPAEALRVARESGI